MDVKLAFEGTTRNPAVLPKYGERLAEDLLIQTDFLMRRIIKRKRLLCQVKNFKRSGMWDSLGSYLRSGDFSIQAPVLNGLRDMD